MSTTARAPARPARRQVMDSAGARKADLAAIHMAKADLGWDDDFYRDILFSVCRVRSAGELDHTGRKRFMAHLQACGWTARRAAPAGGTAAARKPLSARQAKIWSLWQKLFEAGAVENRKMPALAAYVHRQTGVDRLEWLKPAQEDLVIESLKKWLARFPKGAKP